MVSKKVLVKSLETGMEIMRDCIENKNYMLLKKIVEDMLIWSIVLKNKSLKECKDELGVFL